MFVWDGVEILMAPRGYWNDKKIGDFHEECKANVKEGLNKAQILDAKYEKINVEEIIEDQDHLDKDKREQLKSSSTKRQKRSKVSEEAGEANQ